jgi:hypothetical protein
MLPLFCSFLSYERDSSLWKSRPHRQCNILKRKAIYHIVQNRTSLSATLVGQKPPDFSNAWGKPVQNAGLDAHAPAPRLLRLGAGVVSGGHRAVPEPDGRGRVHGWEGIRDDGVTALPEHLVVVQSLVDFFVRSVDLAPARSTP